MGKKKGNDVTSLPDIGCTLKELPPALLVVAAETATRANPVNAPQIGDVTALLQAVVGDADTPVIQPEHLALLTTKYWGTGGVHLTVGFLDNAPTDLQKRILQHMNAWGAFCNAKFSLSNTDPDVRIARAEDGYWSYLGTDILHIPASEPTMNLQGFTMNTPESEYHRVVRHETGHTLGFPHEHLRREIIDKLDRDKTLAYFEATQGWSAQMVIQQVLTPLSPTSIRATEHADQDSIMCYQLPGSITVDGQPIRGGSDIDALDQQFCGSVYPLEVVPPPPPPPPVKPNGGNVFAKIIALIAAVRAKDWPTVLKLIADIITSVSSASDAELAEVEAALRQALPE